MPFSIAQSTDWLFLSRFPPLIYDSVMGSFSIFNFNTFQMQSTLLTVPKKLQRKKEKKSNGVIRR